MSGNSKPFIRTPQPISEAKKDGTKYIVWDAFFKEWYIGYFVGNAWVEAVAEQLITPTYFVEYFPNPTEN